VPGTSQQRLPEFLTNRPGEEEARNRQHVQQLSGDATLGEGVLVVGDTGFPKQGKAAVGIARPDSGPVGQVGNGQRAVTCCATDRRASWPVAVRLSWPHAWAADPDRRRQARVPAAVTLHPTPELALSRLDQARAWGVRCRCVVADADSGGHPNSLAGLERRQARDGVGRRADVRASHRRSATSPVQRADRVLQGRPRGPWRAVRWRQGTTGRLRQTFVAIRCWQVTRGGQRHVGGLLRERTTRGQPEERPYSWSHLPAGAALAELASSAQRR
jgi:SRSO17 transposase